MNAHGPVWTGLRMRDAQGLVHGAFGRMQPAMALAALPCGAKMRSPGFKNLGFRAVGTEFRV